MKLFDLFLYFMIGILFVICLYPFLYIVNVAISDSHMVTNGSVYLIPKGINFNAISTVLKSKMIGSGYLNSILYTSVGTLMTLILCSTAGYVLNVREFRIKKLVMMFFALTMFFNGGLIPSFLIIRDLKLLDSIWAVTIPGALSAWNIILFKTNFKYIPKEIMDSARIDGAGHFMIYSMIVIPLSMAIIATIGLFTIVGYWNSYFPALLYLSSQDKQPLMIVLRKLVIVENMRGEFEKLIASALSKNVDGIGFSRSLKMASILISLSPIIIIYPFLQKYFVKGVLVGSLKE